MDILHLGKAQIAALGDRAGRVRPGMATKRDRCGPIGGDRIGIKVRGETREAGLASVIASLLRPRDIAGERVHRLDRGDAMALAHQPGARSGAQRVSGEISDERRNHVERPARMAFRRGLESIGWRSEEQTSELQSLMRISYAVFCLKKKKTRTV